MGNNLILTLTLNPAVDVSIDAPEVVDTLKIRCENAVYDPGGGGVNVARILQRLGGTTIAHIAAGGGVGRLLVSLLKAEDVSYYLHEITAMTRQNFAVTEISTGKQFRFVLPGSEMTRLEVDLLLERLFAGPQNPKAIIASGSLPPGVADDIYADIARRCHGAGIFFALDTSGAPLQQALDAPIGLLKVNEREITDLLGTDWLREGQALVERGSINKLVVTKGAEGAVLISDAGLVEAVSPPVKEISAVGAGDSFMAAMVLALCRDWPEKRALKYALATGAAAALTSASDLARREDVDRLFSQMMEEN